MFKTRPAQRTKVSPAVDLMPRLRVQPEPLRGVTSKNLLRAVALIALAVIVAGCTAGPDALQNTRDAQGHDPAGFWLGVWHGMICPFMFLGSLFDPSVHF